MDPNVVLAWVVLVFVAGVGIGYSVFGLDGVRLSRTERTMRRLMITWFVTWGIVAFYRIAMYVSTIPEGIAR